MQTDAIEDDHVDIPAGATILNEITRKPLAALELKRRVRKRVRGLTSEQYEFALDALLAEHKIHGRLRLGKTGRPTKTVESYALGAPPPPPPSPGVLARKEVLALLAAGPMRAVELKRRLREIVAGLAVKVCNSVLAELAAEHEIHALRKRNRNGTPAKSVESYALGPQSPDDFIVPVLTLWRQMRAEAKTAGIEDRFVSAFLDGLSKEGILRPPEDPNQSDDREEVMRCAQNLGAREGRGALIPIRKLRGAVRLVKSRFDAAVLQLYADDAVILHHHDYVGSLSQTERDELVLDRHGNYYVGLALRGES